MDRLNIPIPPGGIAADPLPGSGRAARMNGMWYQAGRLRTMEGRLFIGERPHVYGSDDPEFGNHAIYHAQDGTPYVIARAGVYMWLGIVDGSGVVDWRLMWGDTSSGEVMPGYPARTAGTDEAIIQINDVLYFSGGGVPGRWAGYEMHIGRVERYGETTDWITASAGPTWGPNNKPQVGDTIYFRLYDSANEQFGWFPVGFVIIGVSGTYNCNLHLDGDLMSFFQNQHLFQGRGPNGGNSVEYQIVRCSQMGVPPGVTGSETSLYDDPQKEGVGPGTYRYYWRYRSDVTGYFGNMSDTPDTAATANVTNSTDNVLLGGTWSLTPPEPHVTAVEIWRTTLSGPLVLHTGTPGVDELVWTLSNATSGTLWVTIGEPGQMSAVGIYLYGAETMAMFQQLGTGPKKVSEVVSSVNTNMSAYLSVQKGDGVSDNAYVQTVPPTDIIGNTETAYQLRAVLTYAGETPIADSFVDDNTSCEDAYPLQPDYLYYDRPGAQDVGQFLYYWQDALVTADATYPNRLRKSSTGAYEYWPISRRYDYGGYYPITNSIADAIVDMTGEGGSYAMTGRVGGALLVATRTGLHRVTGSNWSEFAVDKIAEIGAVARTMFNTLGYTLFLSPDGPMRLQVGGLTPEPIYTRLWPRGMRLEFDTAEQLLDSLSQSRAFVFGHYWAVQIYDGTTYTLYYYNIPADTWSAQPLDSKIASFALWNGPYDVGQITAADEVGLWRLHTQTDGVTDYTPSGGQPFEFVTAPVLPSPEEWSTRYAKLISVTAQFRAPIADQDVTLAVYVDGDLSTARWSRQKSLLATESGAQPITQLVWYPRECRGREFQFGISGAATRPIELAGLQMAYTRQEIVK